MAAPILPCAGGRQAPGEALTACPHMYMHASKHASCMLVTIYFVPILMESLLSMTQMVSGKLGQHGVECEAAGRVGILPSWQSLTVEEQIALAAVGVPARCPGHPHC